MILFVDTALTGRYHYREPDDASIQPHLCRFAALLVDETTSKEALDYSRLIEPRESWTFEVDAVVAHGITRQRAFEEGQPIEKALSHFLLMKAEAALIVAFNWDHHRRVLLRAAHDCGVELDLPNVGQPGVACAMREATDIIRMPSMRPGGGYAWPKMADAYSFFTNGQTLPKSLDPMDHGILMVRAIRTIYDGVNHHRSNP